MLIRLLVAAPRKISYKIPEIVYITYIKKKYLYDMIFISSALPLHGEFNLK